MGLDPRRAVRWSDHVTIVHQQAWHFILDKRKWRFDVQPLHPEDRAWMMQERDCAVRILIERGLYEGTSAEELAKGPLGQLHLPTP